MLWVIQYNYLFSCLENRFFPGRADWSAIFSFGVTILHLEELEKKYKAKTTKRKRKPELTLDYMLIGGTMVLDFVIQKFAIGIETENEKVTNYFKLLNQLKQVEEDKITRQQQTRHQDQLQAARFQQNIGVGVLENLEPRLEPIIKHEVARLLQEKENQHGL